MSLPAALVVGFGSSILSYVLALMAWGEWGYRHLPSWTDWPLLIAFLLLNVAGWIVGVFCVG